MGLFDEVRYGYILIVMYFNYMCYKCVLTVNRFYIIKISPNILYLTCCQYDFDAYFVYLFQKHIMKFNIFGVWHVID